MDAIFPLKFLTKAEPVVVPANVRCHRPWTGFELFDHLGDVRPCCWGKVSCGNVNQQTPAEIWHGQGFELYRRAMREGRLDQVCKSECPVLQGHYTERFAEPSPPPPPDEAPGDASPKFLRVVPSIRCNLRCPMCYQLKDPPPDLPSGLFEQLSPWMRQAEELLILGGETFLASECLSWIERLTPDAFPSLKLAAITNGLCFSPRVLELIANRRWSWMLVSIDAATAPTFGKVRGGSFAELLRSLDRLAAVRRTMSPFELRFGFTLQRSNLPDAERFLDLCELYDAMPQFTTVVGGWHTEAPRHHRDYDQFTAVLEIVDKQLWSRGFSDRLIAGALERLQLYRRRRFPSRRPHREIHVDASQDGQVQSTIGIEYGHARLEPRLLIGHGDFSAHDWVDTAIAGTGMAIELAGSLATHRGAVALPRHYVLDIGVNADPCAIEAACRCAGNEMAHLRADTRLLTVVATPALAEGAGVVADWARRQGVRGYRIALSHIAPGDAALTSVRPVVRTIRHHFASRQIPFLGGVANLAAYGLHPSDQFAAPRLAFERRRDQMIALTILSPAYNLASTVERFIASVGDQTVDVPCELIVVDDGSRDATIERCVAAASHLPASMDVLVLNLPRRQPYRHGTFSFRAGLARQAGLLSARGQRVLFVDADQRLASGCAQAHVAFGRYFDVVLGDRDHESNASVEGSHSLELRQRNVSGRREWWTSFYTGNASVRTDMLVAAGGFDETLQFWGLDDTDLGYRLARAGASVWHTMRARVEHFAGITSGGGTTIQERRHAWGIHRDVLYRKYLDERILDAFTFLDAHA
jgi:glycosyltransferase involved in cell wall biosynthesis/MoaA/NifB/PqqE/SkfB family radical SAM enzyme